MSDFIDQAKAGDPESLLGPAIVDDNGNAALVGYEQGIETTPSAKGPSRTRKWGVKDHIERLTDHEKQQIYYGNSPFDWLALYMLEKESIEKLTQDHNLAPPFFTE